MASDCGDGDYLRAYRQFFEEFLKRINPDDQLPVKMSGYDLTEGEIVGEIITITLEYLNQKYCPPSLQSYMVRLVIEEIKSMCRKRPEDCGLKPNENTYAPLKLMQAVTSRINEICLRYMDNSRLALLPPPPSTSIPLVSSCAIKNTRRRMEDRHVILHDLHTIFSIQDDSIANYYAVFDGHAGHDAAVYCASHLHQYLAESIHYPTDPVRALRDAFLTTDAYFIEKSKEKNVSSGTTAACALLLNKKLYIAWAGDSQAVLARQGHVSQLVNPHKPEREDERERVQEMGGSVVHCGIWRVNGNLGVSRAIGDTQYKPYVTGDPDIRCISLNGTEDFLIVACDGLWDFVSEMTAASLVYQQVYHDPHNLEEVSQKLVQYSKKEGSCDNITAIVVFLTPPKKIAARQPHPLRADVQLNNMEPNNPFLSNANGQFDVNAAFVKQQNTNGDGGADAENDELFVYKPRNGKHTNGATVYDDEDEDQDLGPETDVDAVDDATCTPLAELSRELFPEKPGNREQFQQDDDDDDDSPPSSHEKPNQHVLIPEADNVGDSEDSEDEWNYYRIGPNKEKTSTISVDEGSDFIKDEKSSDCPVLLNKDNDKKTTEIQLPKIDFNSRPESEKDIKSSELIDTDICAKGKLQEDSNYANDEEDDNMDFQLNPNAAEFVPVSPSRIIPGRMEVGSDFPISGSPFKESPVLDDVSIPSQEEFNKEICHRPREMNEKERSNGDRLTRTEFTDYLIDRQKGLGTAAISLDESEVSSTKAEFGDESSTSFPTSSDFHRTGVSTLDDSFTGSEREDYDIAKDPMAMSFTPADFEKAFKLDLNAVHDLRDVDLSGVENGVDSTGIENGVVPEDGLVVSQSPELFHPELATLVTPEEIDHPPHSVAFPDESLNSADIVPQQEVASSVFPEFDGTANIDLLDAQLDGQSSSPLLVEQSKLSETSGQSPVPCTAVLETEVKEEADPVVDLVQEPSGSTFDADSRLDFLDHVGESEIVAEDAATFLEGMDASHALQDIAAFTVDQTVAAPVSIFSSVDDSAEVVSPQPLAFDSTSSPVSEDPSISPPILEDREIASTAVEDEHVLSTISQERLVSSPDQEEEQPISFVLSPDASEEQRVLSLDVKQVDAAAHYVPPLSLIYKDNISPELQFANREPEYIETSVTDTSFPPLSSDNKILDSHNVSNVAVFQNPLDLHVEANPTNQNIDSTLESVGVEKSLLNEPPKESSFELFTLQTSETKDTTSTFDLLDDNESEAEVTVEEREFNLPPALSPADFDNKIAQHEYELDSFVPSATEKPQEDVVEVEKDVGTDEAISSAPLHEDDLKEDIIDTKVHDKEPHQEVSYVAPVLNLSESMQEFTGLERQLSPEKIAPIETDILPDIQKEAESYVSPVDTLTDSLEKKDEAPQELIEVREQHFAPEVPAEISFDQKIVAEDTPKIVEDVEKDNSEDIKPETKKEQEQEAALIDVNESKAIDATCHVERAAADVTNAAVAVAVAATTAAVTAVAAAKATKAKPAATKMSKTALTTSKTAAKSTPSSPTKTASATTRTSTSTTARKPSSTLASSRSKPTDTIATKSTATSLAAKTSAPKTSTTTKATTAATRPSTIAQRTKMAGAPLKANVAASTTDNKKPTTNGDVKPLSKVTGPKPAPRSTSNSVPSKTLVKSSTTSRTSTSATAPKARPASATSTTTSTGAKPAARSTVGTTMRPKTAPTATAAKTRLSSNTGAITGLMGKSPVIDKQIKETANKQISSARTSTTTVSKTGRVSTSSTSTTTIRRTTATSKTSTVASSPTKKTAPISKIGGKGLGVAKSSTKVLVSPTIKTKVVQNGVSEEREVKTTESNTVKDDVPKKDDSPVTPPTDNQLIIAAD